MRAGSPRVQLRIGRPLAEVAPREGPELVVLKVQSASCGTCEMGSEPVATLPYVADPNHDQLQPDAPSLPARTRTRRFGEAMQADRMSRRPTSMPTASCNVYGMAWFGRSPTIWPNNRAQQSGPTIGMGCLAAAKGTGVDGRGKRPVETTGQAPAGEAPPLCSAGQKVSRRSGSRFAC